MSAPGPPPDDGSPVERRTGSPRVASGESPTSARGLVGREPELARVDALLRDATDRRSATLLVEGEPGVGKTTLLEAARNRARGFTHLSARGVESESHVAYAGLLELLHPLRDLLDEVPEAQAGALRTALGWSARAAAADRFLVGAATLSLLAAAAERGPVLVVVDDLPWLDPESWVAILFAARRLGPDAATSLLPDGTAEGVRDRLVAETSGNPLALLEVSQRLEAAQLLGTSPLPDSLPAGERLRRVHETAVVALSPAARRAVLLLALSGATPQEATAMAGVLEGSGEDAGAVLDEARGLGVLVRDGAHHAFRHPLLRSTVLELATPAEQREARRALAEWLPAGDRARVWHLAESTVGTDPTVAQELARLADADRHRLGHAASSAALERSWGLTDDRDLAAASRRTARTRSWPATSYESGHWSTGCWPRTRPSACAARRCSRWGCWSSTPGRCRVPSSTWPTRRTCSTARCASGRWRSWRWPASASTTSPGWWSAPAGSRRSPTSRTPSSSSSPRSPAVSSSC